MSGFFEVAGGGGPRIELDEVERGILRSLAVQMMELIGPGPGEEESGDPLAALFEEGPTEAPDDPALARLFPDAYGDPGADGAEDAETAARAAEFRKFTEPDLRRRKREDALGMIRSLDGAETRSDGAVVLELDGEQTRHWLGALNDLRLTLGSRLEVTDDDDRAYRMPDTDPNKPLMMAYLWLGGLQETLLGAMTA